MIKINQSDFMRDILDESFFLFDFFMQKHVKNDNKSTFIRPNASVIDIKIKRLTCIINLDMEIHQKNNT